MAQVCTKAAANGKVNGKMNGNQTNHSNGKAPQTDNNEK